MNGSPEPSIGKADTDDVEMTLTDELVDEITRDPRLKSMVEASDAYLANVGYTRHGESHVKLVARRAQRLALEIGYGQPVANMGYIAGYVHDIGNLMGRENHGAHSALLAYPILMEKGVSNLETVKIMTAVANHEERVGKMVNDVAAFLVLADKSDVHKNRVRETHDYENDIHDKVNIATHEAKLLPDPEAKVIQLNVEIDTDIATPLEYFEIFTERMVMSRNAASYLGYKFSLVINNQEMS